MRVFVTGGTGLIGSAVVAELLLAGHTVDALARSDRSARALQEAGARPVPGGLGDLDVVRAAADDADGTVHLASPTDASDESVAEEAAALAAIGTAIAGSGRGLVMASGTPWVPGRTATELDPLPVDGPFAGRQATVTRMLTRAEQGVWAVAVRIPRTAHRDGRGGFAGVVVDLARREGVAGWVGDGTQRWPAVHVLDAAVLFRLALEHAPAGTAWHAVGEEGVPMGDIARAVGRRLDLPSRQVPQDFFGPLGSVCALDQPASSTRTRHALGWAPAHTPLLTDLEALRP